MPYKDLRGFLAALRERGDLHTVEKEVDWDLEIGSVMRKIFDQRGPAVLFQRVKDSAFPLVSGVMDTYDRYALALGVEPDLRSIFKRTLDAVAAPIPPIVVKRGPCKENIDQGKKIDLHRFPAPRWHSLDGGRFLGTLGAVILKDPETGTRNMGIYRGQVLAKDKLGLLATQHAGIVLTKYQSMRKPMPVAIAIGVEPAVLSACCFQVAYGVDELGIAGGLRAEPVEMVKCETVDLEVPASAEIVLEGEVPADESKWEEEGPFGEFPGYYGGMRFRRPTIYLSAVTYRDNPIVHGTLEGAPPNESNTIRTIGHTTGIWDRLRRTGVPGLKEFYLTDMGCAVFTAVASLERHYYAGNARQLIEAIFATSLAKWAIVVDGDVDIYDREQVEWALATRVQPHRDIIVTPDGEPGVNLDPAIPPGARAYPQTHTSKVGIDATVHFKGYEFSPIARPSQEEMAQVEARWHEYGF
ncbi:MAG: UbiD family decarboxylase [Dehalococcoidia bacterium]|nr:UbiD family decarboxylase [Dehalococcoidia bacterium]